MKYWVILAFVAIIGSLAGALIFMMKNHQGPARARNMALALALAIALGWWNHARQLLSLRELLTVPLYAAWKLPVYVSYFLKRKSGWTRTARKV